MNTEQHRAQHDAWERGYREALLDVYVFLLGDEQALDIDPTHLSLLHAMIAQVNSGNSRLVDVTELPVLVS